MNEAGGGWNDSKYVKTTHGQQSRNCLYSKKFHQTVRTRAILVLNAIKRTFERHK